jgi:large subunit ribosomal protein L13
MTNKTFLPSSNSYSQRKWYVIDCKDKTLGRTCSVITKILQGKHKPFYHPAADLGDNIILINAMDLTLHDTKRRAYVFRPGRPGSSLSFKTVRDDHQNELSKTVLKI